MSNKVQAVTQNYAVNDFNVYGIAVYEFDNVDISTDIFSHIRRAFIKSGIPQVNSFSHQIGADVYVYDFALEKNSPIKWLVTKNGEKFQEAKQQPNDTYIVNSYDGGRLSKSEYYSIGHAWQKTVYSCNTGQKPTLCVVQPYQIEGVTAILKFIETSPKPMVYMQCNVPTTPEAYELLNKNTPDVDVAVFSDTGINYYACEEKKINFDTVLAGIEADIEQKKYQLEAEANRKISGGFALEQSDFNVQGANSYYRIQDAGYFKEDAADTRNSPYGHEYQQQAPADLPSAPIQDAPAYEPQPQQQIQETYEGPAPYSVTKSFAEIEQPPQTQFQQSQAAVPPQYVEHAEYQQPMQTIQKHQPPSHGFHNQFIGPDEAVQAIPDAPISAEYNGIISEIDAISSEIKGMIDKTETANDGEIIDELLNSCLADLNNVEQKLPQILNSMPNEQQINMPNTIPDAPSAAPYVPQQRSALAQQKLPEEKGATQDNPFTAHNILSYLKPDAHLNSGNQKYYYYGDLNAENKRHGYGKTLMEDGRTAYDGQYKDNKRDGFGVFYYKNGNFCYAGDWKDNKKDGVGICRRDSNGDLQLGRWQKDKPFGVTARMTQNGELVYVGKYDINGKREGVGVTFDSNKNPIVSIWREDREIQILYSMMRI